MGTATLRPNADVYDTGASFSTGTTSHTLLSDNSDASWVTCNFPGHLAVAFGTTSLPSGARVKSITPRARVTGLAGSAVTNSVRLIKGGYPGPTAETPPTSWQTTGLTTTNVVGGAFASAWSTADPWSQDDIDNIQILVGPEGSIKYLEMYLDVLYAEISTVTVSSVTEIATVTPHLSWIYAAGTDNGPQAGATIKVFSSAQYGAGGFDPDTSEATYETTISGAASSLQVPAGHLTATTYKAYVQAWSLINGQPHYTAWAASSSWTVALDPPAPATLTVTEDEANFRVLLEIQGHNNRVSETDSNFEDNSVGTLTPIFGSCSLAASTAQALTPGTHSVEMTTVGAGAAAAATALGDSGFPVFDQSAYRLFAYVRANGTTRTANLSVDWWDENGDFLSSDNDVDTGSATSGGWLELTADITTPTDAAFGDLKIGIAGAAGAGEKFYWDHLGVLLIAGDAPSQWYRGGLVPPNNTADLYHLVEYSDDSGSTWRTVFNGSAVELEPGQTAELYDYTCNSGVTRQYRVTPYFVQSGATVYGASSAGSATANMTLTDTRLVDVIAGEQVVLRLVDDAPIAHRRPSSATDTLGGEYPIVQTDRRKAGEGTLIVETVDEDERDDLHDLLDSDNTFLLQKSSAAGGGTRWIRILDDRREPLSRVLPHWERWELPYLEVAAPSGA